MSYYKILGLEKEPFSTSPDPEFFYQFPEHKEALLRMEIAIKLRRGLSVILGDVGVGKTTLARKLYEKVKGDSRISFHMMLDPTADSEIEFLSNLTYDVFGIDPAVSLDGRNHVDGRGSITASMYKKVLEQELFKKGVNEDRIVVLLIDEAQNLQPFSLEILRLLLNYETNRFKLLQLVLLGQMELLPSIKGIKNFWDRISLKYCINPLNRQETAEMVKFRLAEAGYKQRLPIFTDAAIDEVYDYTQGFPRRITIICHDALEELVIKNREVVERRTIRELIARDIEYYGYSRPEATQQSKFGIVS